MGNASIHDFHCIMARDMTGKFGEFLDKAEKLIGKTGYQRRDGELMELKGLNIQ